MSCGLKNAPATFQRLVNNGLDTVEAYMDDVIDYDMEWDDHLKRTRALFKRLSEAKLTVNLAKCEFGKAQVEFLEHAAGHGQIPENFYPHRYLVLPQRKEDNIQVGASTKVVLLAYMRSGSSLTGDVVQQSPDVFYMFEPLFSMEKQLSHYFDINNKRFNSKKVERHQHILESLLTCNLSSLDYMTLTQHHLVNSLSTTDYFNCTRNVKSISDLHECLGPVRSTCATSRVVFAKVIRTNMIAMYHLLSTYPEFKVIHLLRDPRGLLASQNKVGHLPDGITASAEATCGKMYSDVERSIGYKKRFPGRVLTVRYEDIALDPLHIYKQVYDFLGIDLTKNIQNYILDMTSNSVTNCGARCIRKNSSFTVFKWRRYLSYFTMSKIDRSCSKLYRKVGYLPHVKSSNSFGATLADMPEALSEV
ncbi:carbohydrate sulfotransferase 3-like [Haliotis asinina]|uniref:carbohydrate sulfotransferase 3-like n=1 Tax=Haliotis asinina TaxID=109174 RepID=UPI003531CFB6